MRVQRKLSSLALLRAILNGAIRFSAVFFFTICPAFARTGSINLSQDLVSLGIASTNLTPNNPAVDARPLFQAALQYIASHPVQLLTADPGNYYFLTSQNQQDYLRFSGLSNLTVDLAGSAIYFNGAFLHGFELTQCQHVTLTNFQTDFLNPPYTHVQIASVNSTARTFAYATLPNWPDPATFNNVTTPFGAPVIWAVVFRNGSIVPGTSRMQVIQPIANNTIQLVQDNAPWIQTATLSTLAPGDTIVVTQRGGEPTIRADNSDSIVISNVTIHGSGTMAVLMNAVSNSTVDHVTVTPRSGTGLIAANADGIHFGISGPNNHIRNCYVTRTLDDALAIDSLDVATVVSQSGPRQVRVTRSAYLRFPNGTPVNFVDPVTTNELQGAPIVSQNPPDSSSPAFNGPVDLTFDQDLPVLPAGAGMTFMTAALRGSGSTIEDNVVTDIPFGRGVWIGGGEGVTIQRNVIRRTSNGGIVVHQNSKAYPGPPAHDITVQSNVLEGNLGPMASGSGTQIAVGAIIIESLDNTNAFASTSPNTNISILNNYVADSGRSGIWVGELSRGTIQDNVIVRWHSHPELPLFGVSTQVGQQLLQDFQQPIVLHNSQNLDQLNNTTDLQSGLTGAVTLNPALANFGSVGGSGSISVQPNLTNFEWSATSDSSWLTVSSGPSGMGTGIVRYAVASNSTGSVRAGSITISGLTFQVQQGLSEVPVPFSAYYFPHLALGGGWQTTVTYVNYSPQSVTCQTTFLSDAGAPLSVSFGGAAAFSRIDTLAPGATLHQQSTAELSALVVTGWAQAQCTGPVKASLLFRLYTQGVAQSEAGVNAMSAPATRFFSFAETQTGVAYANPSTTQSAAVTIAALNSTGQTLGSKTITLSPGQHTAAYVGPLLNLTSFTGLVQITATAPIISLTLNFEASPAFSSLPPGEISGSTVSGTSLYYFSHLALGGGWQTTLTYVNYSSKSVTCQTTFFSDSGTLLPVAFGETPSSSRSDTLPAGATLHRQSTADLNAAVITGWARAQCTEPVKASLLFRLYSRGTAIAEAGVNAMTAPATQFATFAETQTGVAFANPSTQPAIVTITVLSSIGQVLGKANSILAPGTHSAAYIGPLLGLSSFTGSVQITTPIPIISLSLNFEASPVFSSLPPGELDASTPLGSSGP